MKFEYDVAVDAPKESVWALLSDIQRAARMVPGVQCVTPRVDGTYGVTVRIRVGAIGFNLSGVVAVDEDREAGKWTMRSKAQDPRVGGGVACVVETAVSEPSQGRTAIQVTAEIQFFGRLGQLGQPLARKKADSMFKEFTENLKKAVANGSENVLG